MTTGVPVPGGEERGWLVADRVSLVYGAGEAAITALRNVTLKLRPGAFVALRGPSGSGKTSLLHCLGGLQAPTAGQVRWDSRPLRALDATARSAERGTAISYLFQGSNLLETFTAEQNLAFAAYVAGNREPSLEPALLSRFGLGSKAEAIPDELSGGEQQRLALARALAQQPRVLLADEPTAHLDSETSAAVLALIQQVHRETGMTVVIATHDARVAERAVEVFEMRDGVLSQ